MSNRLNQETSPYLLQHANNPVDWYPWGEEAFEKAGKEDKPIFLSIGYSTCHWCHVMAHESFENEKIAEILNKNFVSIKVDREERPDIDSVYMAVCQAMTGSGGWPMSIFMTPEQKPFYAGTYFPPVSHYGRIGFYDLLIAVSEKWKKDREALIESAEQIVSYLEEDTKKEYTKPESNLPHRAAQSFFKNFDRKYGGFGSAPKFPTPHNLIFLTLYSKIYSEEAIFDQVKVTLEQMRRGGIFDHVGYGFSRYSTDPYFLVPHFEKMLYDNALLILAYSAAYKVSGNGMFLDTAQKTAEYIFREMTGPKGEFYSAQDADSEGEEGRYYVWSYKEILKLLGEEKGKRLCDYYGITEKGNFEGKNIPNLLNGNEISDEFEEERKYLYKYRKSRTKLHLDDKVLTSWNCLMISALSVLYRVTGKIVYLQAAEKNYEFIEEYLVKDKTLYVSFRNKKPSVHGFLDDYAYYGAALLCLYEATSNPIYLKRAEEVAEEAEIQFGDHNKSGYYLYGTENKKLILKPKETYDGAMPSGNSMMAYCLVRLSQLTEKEVYKERADRQLAYLSDEAKQYPGGHSMFQIALLYHLNPPEKITVVLAENEKKEKVLSELPLYADVNILLTQTKEYSLLNKKTTYYVCQNQICLPPENRDR